ncbi:hypothetical protein AF72_03770 [Xylella taiwanensis]|uniref:Uncharacterized protein n=1 Tax=Xylella taiwanensis TaxID=1444770 RepID=Z9JL32_9GAMM|nr:hypothetical protein AF72_03770 [Xylella taiwanensis]
MDVIKSFNSLKGIWKTVLHPQHVDRAQRCLPFLRAHIKMKDADKWLKAVAVGNH